MDDLEGDDFSAFFAAGSSLRGGNDEDRVNVTYVFEPRWPVKGKKEQVVGVLGRDKDVSSTPPLQFIAHS